MSLIGSLRAAAYLGCLLFAVCVVALLWRPQWVEAAASSFIQQQIRGEMASLIEDPKSHPPQAAYIVLRESLLSQGGELAADYRRKLIDGLVGLTARLCKLDCEAKKGLGAWLSANVKIKAERLSVVAANAGEAAQRRYDEMVDRLLDDLQIFSAVNLAAFLLLALAFRMSRDRKSLVLLPIGLLFPATLVAIGLYAFGQDWFYTLVYDDYVGTGYLAYIGVTYLFLFDICFLHGVITQFVLNAIATAVKAILDVLSHCTPSF